MPAEVIKVPCLRIETRTSVPGSNTAHREPDVQYSLIPADKGSFRPAKHRRELAQKI